MYINKNKGFSLVEIIVTLIASILVFQVLYFYLDEINSEKKQNFYRLRFNKDMKLILTKINNSIYESSNYKIYNLFQMNTYIDYTKLSLKKGNTLIIEKYISLEERYTEIEIYHFIDNSIYSFAGKKIRKNEITVFLESRERILKNLNIDFKLEEYGVSMEGFYLNEKIRKDFKK